LVWAAYDRLVRDDLSQVPFSADDEAKEETLNFLLATRIDQCRSGDEPFSVSHQPPEQTKRLPGPGRSPQPDIGFVLYECPRAVWPIEAKVLTNDADVNGYVTDLRANLLTGRYATFSCEGAMLGYLLRGEPSVVLAHIARMVPCLMRPHPAFPERDHRVSDHARASCPDDRSPSTFRCHHLVLALG
jgi:hypothetical protein